MIGWYIKRNGRKDLLLTYQRLRERSYNRHYGSFKRVIARLAEMGILYHRIRIATPRHNGKVERQHRTDELRFYSKLRMHSLVDGRKQMALYQAKSNDHIKTCLNFRSPNQVLADYLAVM